MSGLDPAELVRQFIRPWNSDDAAERRRLILGTCAEDIEVFSPYGVTRGIEEQLTEIGNFRQRYPHGACVARVLAEHHGEILFTWRTTFGDDQTPELTGIDVLRLDEEGRIALSLSFSPVAQPPVKQG